MVIWSGLGFLGILFLGLGFLSMDSLINKVFADPNYYSNNWWPDLLVFIIAGLLSFFLGRYLNNRKGRVLVDKETGQEVIIRPNHSLFFIKLEYWGIIFPVLGLLKLIFK